ncbi:glycosyltransferase family 1 protein [Labedella phragmitis]|uniref:Glycosyltransferase family 1 protein n=1 Tax=Labedella phragmitis TaxID=2498849 RepID=A0A444PPM0_9MICO|nr:glycosyltransferase family 1 protein [Labedella phragmitis]
MQSVHVLLDGTAIPDELGGVGRYLEGVTPELRGDGVRVTVVTRRSLAASTFTSGRGYGRVVVGDRFAHPLMRMLWEQFRLPRIARALGADVIHSPHYTFPLLSRSRSVVTVHDATFFTLPADHSVVKRWFFRAWTLLGARRADVLVAPSAATFDELAPFAPVETGRAVVAHHGVDLETFRPPTDDAVADFRRGLGLPESGWIAFLGTLEPRKNVPALIDAYVERFAGTTDPPALVLAGARGWDTTIDDHLSRVPDDLTVVLPGYLPREELHVLLGGALTVVYPSRGEGFGLPVLEAMASGASVITTRESSLPEVGGDAVVYAGTDVSSIGEAISTIVADTDARARRSDAARERAAGFTWAASAAAHRDAYRRAAARR